jgi:hypothetical protein
MSRKLAFSLKAMSHVLPVAPGAGCQGACLQQLLPSLAICKKFAPGVYSRCQGVCEWKSRVGQDAGNRFLNG